MAGKTLDETAQNSPTLFSTDPQLVIYKYLDENCAQLHSSKVCMRTIKPHPLIYIYESDWQILSHRTSETIHQIGEALLMRYGDSLSLLSLVSSVYWGDFPVQPGLVEAGRVNFLGYSYVSAQR